MFIVRIIVQIQPLEEGDELHERDHEGVGDDPSAVVASPLSSPMSAASEPMSPTDLSFDSRAREDVWDADEYDDEEDPESSLEDMPPSPIPYVTTPTTTSGTTTTTTTASPNDPDNKRSLLLKQNASRKLLLDVEVTGNDTVKK